MHCKKDEHCFLDFSDSIYSYIIVVVHDEQKLRFIFFPLDVRKKICRD